MGFDAAYAAYHANTESTDGFESDREILTCQDVLELLSKNPAASGAAMTRADATPGDRWLLLALGSGITGWTLAAR